MKNDKKVCQSCGRWFENRKKWGDKFHLIKYCSKSCSSKKTPTYFKAQILKLLEGCSNQKTISPLDVLGTDEKNHSQLERVRSAARLLAHEGLIEILQKSKKVDPSSFKGSIEIRKI